MQARKTLPLLTLCGLLAFAGCSDAVPSTGPGADPAHPRARTTDLTLEGPNVIFYEHPEVLEKATRSIRQGEFLPGGGCRFSGSAVLAPGEAITELELAFDPDSCRSLVETGTLVSRGTPAADPAWFATDAEVRDSVAASAAGAASFLTASVAQSAYIHSWYADPPGLHVNDVTSTIEWAPDGTCAWPAGSTAVFGRKYDWLWQTGWSLNSYNWSYGASCASVYNESTVHFVNNVFCLLMVTNTYYEPNRVEGLPDGRAAFAWSNRKDGRCSFLLSINRTYGHGAP
jgi:hypothetical protein